MSGKDVEEMNHFELLNEVERLRRLDVTDKLKSEVGRLENELRLAKEEIRVLKRRLDFVIKKGVDEVEYRAKPDRRTQPQGRRRPATRRGGVVKS